MRTTETLFGTLSQFSALKETVERAIDKPSTCLELHQLFTRLPRSLKDLAFQNGFTDEVFQRELTSFIKADGECL